MRKTLLVLYLLLMISAKAQRRDIDSANNSASSGETKKAGAFIDVNASNYPESAFNIDELINNVLISGGNSCSGSVFNVKVSPLLSSNDPTRSYGYFNRGTTNFPFNEGIILMTGFAKNAGNNLITGNLRGILPTDGDEDLAEAIGVDNSSLLDATSIEFDFIPVNNQLKFTYIFASEEYVDSFACNFTDGFALLIRKNGDANYTNLAVLPDNAGPVSVTNIHPSNDYCDERNVDYYYGYNANPVKETNFNGRTIPLYATTTVIPGETYHFKMVLADYGDRLYDSGVFIKAGSFNIGLQINDENGEMFPKTLGLCVGTSKILNAEVTTAGATYQWFFNGNIILGATSPIYTVSEAGVYKVELIAPGLICPLEAQLTVFIAQPPTIAVTAPKTTICSGESLLLTASGGQTYTFSGLPGNGDTQNVSPTITTTYTVTGKSEYGCQGNSTSITITVIPPIFSVLKDVVICKGSSAVLDAGAGPNYTYQWSTGETTQTITVTKDGIYTVVINNGVCTETFSATVSYLPVPEIANVLYEKNTLTISMKPPLLSNLEYSVNGGLTWQNSNVFNNILRNVNYLISVRVLGETCFATVSFFTFYVNNVMTPNGDGVNEEIDFSGISKYKDFGAVIVDRFGKEVFRATATNAIWNSNHIKLNIPSASYWYQVFWTDPISNLMVQKTGWILLKNRN